MPLNCMQVVFEFGIIIKPVHHPKHQAASTKPSASNC